MPNKRVSILLPDETVYEITIIAAKKGVTRSAYIRQLLALIIKKEQGRGSD